MPDRPPLVELLYTYDAASNRLSAVDGRPGAALPLSHEYLYDGLHRLKEAQRGVWDGTDFTHDIGSRKWTLDMLGNWSSVLTNLNGDDSSGDPDYSDSGETETRTHNGVNELTARNTDGTGGDEVTLTFDKAGNLRTSTVASGPTTTYTHDCWNRLVKVAVTPSGGSASTRAKYEYNGLTWRTRKLSDSDLSAQSGDTALDEERVMTYSANWQLLEERIDRNYQSDAGLNARSQHVWGLRYIDDVVLHRRDEKQGSTAPDGDYADTNEGTWYHLTDAQFSTVCVMRPSGDVIERVSYSAYGEARHHLGADVTGDGAADGSDVGEILSGWGTSIGDAGYRSEADLDRDGEIGSADYGLVLAGWGSALASGEISLRSASGPDGVIGWDGYVFDGETKSYKVRFRDYEPVLGRWRQRDPLEYVDSQSLYVYGSASPLTDADPSGLDAAPVGHHYVPTCVVGRIEGISDDARKVFLKNTTGYLGFHHNGERLGGVSHHQYNDAVEEELRKFLKDRNIKPSTMTADQACEFLDRVKGHKCSKPEIKKYLVALIDKSKQIQKKVSGAASRAKQRLAARPSRPRSGPKAPSLGPILAVLGAGSMLLAIEDAYGESRACQEFFQAASRSDCSDGMLKAGQQCYEDVLGLTQEAELALAVLVFKEQYGEACIEAEQARCPCPTEGSKQPTDAPSKPNK